MVFLNNGLHQRENAVDVPVLEKFNECKALSFMAIERSPPITNSVRKDRRSLLSCQSEYRYSIHASNTTTKGHEGP